MNWGLLIGVALLVVLAGGCVRVSAVVVGEPRPAKRAEDVRILLENAPHLCEGAQQLALISSNREGTSEAVTAAARQRAAELGADYMVARIRTFAFGEAQIEAVAYTCPK